MKLIPFFLFLLSNAAFAQEKSAVMPSSIANIDKQIVQRSGSAPLIKIQNGSFEPQNAVTGTRSYAISYGAQNKVLRFLVGPNGVRGERISEWASCGFAQTSHRAIYSFA